MGACLSTEAPTAPARGAVGSAPLACGALLSDAAAAARPFGCAAYEGDEAAAAALLSSLPRVPGAASGAAAWQAVRLSGALSARVPYEAHCAVFAACHGEGEAARGAAYWAPTAASAARTNLAALMKETEGDALWRAQRTGDPMADYTAFHALSTRDPEAFWPPLLARMGVRFVAPPERVLRVPPEVAGGVAQAEWLPGARLNLAACCLEGRDEAANAVVWQDERDPPEAPLRALTFAQLRKHVYGFAAALYAAGLREGDAVAIDMPMNVESVIAFLGVIAAGMVAVSIADSFATPEIATRLRLSEAKLAITQDGVPRGGKLLPLYARVAACEGAPRVVVLPAAGAEAATVAEGVALREGDVVWVDFVAAAGEDAGDRFEPVMRGAGDMTGILFSSGTTGEPKAIPWSALPPLRSAADAHCLQDVRTRDVVCWPTNLGWMMGPWLVYAALLNDATLALFCGAPTGRPFCRFVERARVTMLGLVPSICRAWRALGATEGADWSSVRCFASSGEASNADDYAWLSSRAGYAPVIEYCGGTEIGGGFLAGCPLQPQVASAFSTPTLGSTLRLLTEEAEAEEGVATFIEGAGCGELCLVPPMLGSSTQLLNRDHHKVYYAGMPRGARGEVLRRHGDAVERLPGGYWVAQGRTDDSMNLGGIKVSSVEIERVCTDAFEAVAETAAFSVPPAGGGPERLVIAAVLKAAADGEEAAPPSDATALKAAFVKAVKTQLNPLFKVDEVLVLASLPRTASNKVMRRVLRAQHAEKA